MSRSQLPPWHADSSRPVLPYPDTPLSAWPRPWRGVILHAHLGLLIQISAGVSDIRTATGFPLADCGRRIGCGTPGPLHLLHSWTRNRALAGRLPTLPRRWARCAAVDIPPTCSFALALTKNALNLLEGLVQRQVGLQPENRKQRPVSQLCDAALGDSLRLRGHRRNPIYMTAVRNYAQHLCWRKRADSQPGHGGAPGPSYG